MAHKGDKKRGAGSSKKPAPRVRNESEARKPRARSRADELGIKLEATMPAPKGGVMARCQALKSDRSGQCGLPARSGFRVCHIHGAGSAKREAAGVSRPTGRPPIHGLYSKRGLQDIRALMDEVRELGADLDDTDEEQRALKAVLWFLLEQAEKFQGYAESAASLLAKLHTVNTEGWEIADARDYAIDLKAAASLLAHLDSFTERVADAAAKVILMAKARAETRAKLAETRALARFAELAVGVRNLVWDLLEEDQRDVFEARLRRELFLPNDLEPPAEVGGRGGALEDARTVTV